MKTFKQTTRQEALEMVTRSWIKLEGYDNNGVLNETKEVGSKNAVTRFFKNHDYVKAAIA